MGIAKLYVCYFQSYNLKRTTTFIDIIYNITGTTFSLKVHWVSGIWGVFSMVRKEKREASKLHALRDYSESSSSKGALLSGHSIRRDDSESWLEINEKKGKRITRLNENYSSFPKRLLAVSG